MKEALLGWTALNLLPEVGPIKAVRLLEYFPDPINLFRKKDKKGLTGIPGINLQDVDNILKFDLKEAEVELQLAEKRGFKILTLSDPDYPPLLKSIPDPPILLYVWGGLTEEDQLAIAIVGTRLCSPYGIVQAERFASSLAESRFTIVSGIARGIDTAAHQGALRVKRRTIGVLGSGLLEPYPPENRKLMEKMASSGAVISEFPLRIKPERHTFPRRNRIISGLSRGVLVVEAGIHSGALITATLALEQGREIFALPGPVDQETSFGTNNLIKEGAHLITAPEDIIITLYPTLPFPKTPPAAPEPETTNPDKESEILALLSRHHKVGIEEIASRLNLSLAETGSLLTRLELGGKIKQIPGKQYTLPPP